MGTSVLILFFFLIFSLKKYFLFGRTARHAELPQPGIEPVSPAVEAQSLNHRTTREVPVLVL